ncbi:MAG: HipA domain-containing protein [Chlorobiaceae bacterium]|nr:HipA domain-containing protein [Chlorobiaceae bacterium]
MSMVIQKNASVCLGDRGLVIGSLNFTKSGFREHTAFSYARTWLESSTRFSFSPDLELTDGYQYHKAPATGESVFHLAIADTEPDGWGHRVIVRDHAKMRKDRLAEDPASPVAPLTAWDYLMGVDDVSRIGAIRFLDENDQFVRRADDGGRSVPPLFELSQLLNASRAVERGTETAVDLRFLRGKGTSLGGHRPKCSVFDHDGHLCIGKFPSITDERSVTKGEVLALHLAKAAGITAAESRIIDVDDSPVALVRRFDRLKDHRGRIPFLSVAAIMQARRDEDYSYAGIGERIVSISADPENDLAELWRRIVFNLLVTNVDDHLRNHAFLYTGHGQWRLSPAFDINPFPDKERELKMWMTDSTGPVSSIEEVMSVADRFWLDQASALAILAKVFGAVRRWRELAVSPVIGMDKGDLDDFAPAFEHDQMSRAKKLLG